jgi:broad specificity phosphatase PhoE
VLNSSSFVLTAILHKMKRLYFVRHGQTDTNLAGLLSGDTEAILTDEGRALASATGKRLKAENIRINLIVCSPLLRAVETASLIAKEINYPIEQIIQNKLFKERFFGVLEGTSDFIYLHGGKYKDLDSVEGAETVADLQKRAALALEYVKALPQENILIVGHGASGRALRRVVNGEPHTNEYVGELKIIGNTEIIELI